MLESNQYIDRLKWASPFEVVMATSISRYELTRLVNAGVIRAKRHGKHTVFIEWASVAQYINSLPDVKPEAAPQQKDPMESYNEQRRQATDLFA